MKNEPLARVKEPTYWMGRWVSPDERIPVSKLLPRGFFLVEEETSGDEAKEEAAPGNGGAVSAIGGEAPKERGRGSRRSRGMDRKAKARKRAVPRAGRKR